MSLTKFSQPLHFADKQENTPYPNLTLSRNKGVSNMAKGQRTFTRDENRKVLEVLLWSTELRDSGKPPSALEFLDALKNAIKKTFGQDKLFAEARRIRNGMSKRGYKLYVPSWREADDWIKWAEEWKSKQKPSKTRTPRKQP